MKELQTTRLAEPTLSMYGKVTTYTSTTEFASTNLIGYGDEMFAGTQGFFFLSELSYSSS